MNKDRIIEILRQGSDAGDVLIGSLSVKRAFRVKSWEVARVTVQLKAKDPEDTVLISWAGVVDRYELAAEYIKQYSLAVEIAKACEQELGAQ